MVERYLLGQLSEEEIIQFHLQLIKDPELKTRLAEQEMIMKTLWKSGAKSAGLAKASPVWMWAAVAAVLILGIGAFFFFANPNNSNIQEKTPLVSEPIQEAAEPVQIPSETQVDPSSIEKKQLRKTPKKQDAPVQPVPRKEPTETPPVIASAFKPNPYWENYVGSRTRSNSISVTINKPELESFSNLVNDTLLFECSGQIQTLYDSLSGNFKVYLFSNQLEDFEEFKPIKSWDLKPENEGATYSFHFRDSLTVVPGLYYYLLEEADSSIWHYVGKFSVIQSE